MIGVQNQQQIQGPIQVLIDVIFLRRHAKQPGRRRVRQVDAAVRGQPNYASGYAGEHGLGKSAPLIQLLIGFDQLGALAFELRRHAIERA